MKRKLPLIAALSLALLLIVGIGLAQYGPYEGGRRGRDRAYSLSRDRGGVPTWEKDAEFKDDVFTFVRIRYSSYGGYRRGGKWATDYPDSDLNFSYRLQELTSMKVDPNGKIIELTDPELLDYPFAYLIEPGEMSLTDEEVKGLRRYLESGGFLMVDDFWGEREWENFYHELKRVLPNHEPYELPLEHEIFHCVYDLKQKPQIPSINHYWSGRTYERWDATEPHYRAIFENNEPSDTHGRIMVLICHNTDLGDGWEREGVDPGYFRDFSEKWAYPLGINIITYAMSH